MNRITKILTGFFAATALTLGIAGIVGCGENPPEGKGGDEIGQDYKTVYQQYAEAAGGDALSLENWYSGFKSQVDANEDGNVEELSVITYSSAKYIRVVYQSGKYYLAGLTEGQLSEYALFELNVADASETPVQQVYLDVYSGEYTSGEAEYTVRTDVRGEADVYILAGSSSEYHVNVNEQSAGTYGIPYGYEPLLSVSASVREIDVELGTPQTVSASVKNARGDGLSEVKVSLKYSGGVHDGLLIASDVSDTDGAVSYKITRKADVDYKLYVDEATVPEGYIAPEGPVQLDFDGGAAVITLAAVKKVTDLQIPVNGNPEDQSDEPRRDVELLAVSGGSVITEEDLVKGPNGLYTYNDSSVYVALGYADARILAEGTIISKNTDDATYWSYEEQTDELMNAYNRYLFAELIAAYGDKVNDAGLYPLNDDLLNFVKKAAENDLFATKGENAWLAPLAMYSSEKLGIGTDATYTATGIPAAKGTSTPSAEFTIPVLNTLENGWYKLSAQCPESVDLSALEDTTKAYFGGYTKEVHNNTTYSRWFLLSYDKQSNEFSGTVFLNNKTKAIALKNYTSKTYWKAACDATFKLEKAFDSQIVDITGAGEYTLNVYPQSYMIEGTGTKTNKAVYAYYLNPGRFYAKYNVNVELPEGVTEITAEQLVLYTTTSSPGQIKSTGNTKFTFKETEGVVGTFEGTKEAGSSDLLALLLTHSGSDIITAKVTITPVYSRFNVTYSDGLGGDDVETGPYATTATVSVQNCTFTKPGAVFGGWKYDDGEEETIYLPGDKIENISKDMLLTAVWRDINVFECKPNAGTSVNATIDCDVYTSTEINLEDFATGNYVLKVTLTEEITDFCVYAGATKIYFRYDELSDTYIAFFTKTDDMEKLVFDTALPQSGKSSATLLVENYAEPELNANDDSVLVPVNAYEAGSGMAENTKLVKLASSVVPGTYKLTIDFDLKHLFGNSAPSLKLWTESTSITISGYHEEGNSYLITFSEGDTDVWFMLSSANDKLFGIEVSMHRVYDVIYDKGEAASGTMNADRGHEPGDQIELAACTITYAGHVFRAWSYDDGTGAKEYKPGDKIEMPAKDITVTALWMEEKLSSAAVAVGGEATNVKIDAATYTSVEINYSGLKYADTLNTVYNYRFKADLKNVKVDAPIVLYNTSNKYSIALTYSEALSEDGHNIYTALFSDCQNNSQSGKFTVDQSAFGSAFDFDLTIEQLESGLGTLTADGTKLNVGANPEDYSYYNKFTINLEAEPGEYILHIANNTGKPSADVQPQLASSSDGIFTLGEVTTTENEITIKFTVSSNGQIYASLSGKIYYSFDMWLTAVVAD